MQSGDIAFGLKYLPDEPASTDAVSVSLLLFQIIPKRQCCDSEIDYVFLPVQIGYIQIVPALQMRQFEILKNRSAFPDCGLIREA